MSLVSFASQVGTGTKGAVLKRFYDAIKYRKAQSGGSRRASKQGLSYDELESMRFVPKTGCKGGWQHKAASPGGREALKTV